MPGRASDAARRVSGVEVLSSLDLEALPPFDYAHDHFGYRDRISQPVIAGTDDEPDAGLRGAGRRPGSSSSATRTRTVRRVPLPQPELLSRNGSYMAYRRLEEHVGAFRDFLRQQGRPRRSRSSSRRS